MQELTLWGGCFRPFRHHSRCCGDCLRGTRHEGCECPCVADSGALRNLLDEAHDKREDAMHIIWTIIIGFVAGVIARFFHPGNKYEPKGFILTAVLGIVGAVVATYLGQAVGWYQADENAGFIGAIVGAIIVLVVWGMIAPRLERT